MPYFGTVASSDLDSSQTPALRKLRRLAHLLRAVSAGYACWVLWGILTWWLDAEKVQRNFSSYLGRDLSAMAASQRYGALALDLLAWLLLLAAVVYCWKFLRCLSLPHRLREAAKHISLCAWYAIACETFTELSRPVQSFLLTMHLPATEQLWKWSFRNVDLLAILFCLALLMFAYVFAWTMELAEENRSFV
jgi:hypothetical protein